jgi:hypothetical protein
MKIFPMKTATYAVLIILVLILTIMHFLIQINDSGIHVSNNIMKTEIKVCPTSCPLYFVESPIGKIEVRCEVDINNVNKSLSSCVGIESYNNMREVLCSCDPIPA